MNIVNKNSFKVVGILVETDWNNIHNVMKETWSTFKERIEEIKDRKGKYYLDISLGIKDGIYRQLVCVEVNSFNNIPTGMSCKEIPENKYIYFKHKGHVSSIVESFGKMYKWSKKNGYSTDEFKIDYGYSDNGIEDSHDLYIRIKNTNK